MYLEAIIEIPSPLPISRLHMECLGKLPGINIFQCYECRKVGSFVNRSIISLLALWLSGRRENYISIHVKDNLHFEINFFDDAAIVSMKMK
jgi:hypothetical protein